MKKKQAAATVYIIFFLIIFLAFSAFAVDGTIVLAERAKLQNITEMTTLAAASEFNYSSSASTADKEVQVKTTAESIFNTLKQDSLKLATISIQTKPNEILVTTNMYAQPIFLAFIGVGKINLEAKACAVSEELSVTANYPGINWLTTKAAYLSDILSKDASTWNDTAILLPLGNFMSASYDFPTKNIKFNLINITDGKPLSLGPGGFITIKLPAPIIDKPGDDLFIQEAGDALEGYMVFAGLDNNPNEPYVQKGSEGAKISWVNISCTGTPEIKDTKNGLGTYEVATDGLGRQDKFYGSGYFDIGKSCSGSFPGVSMAKYIRIVDDNSESGFMTSDTTASTSKPYYKTMLYGEASTATTGADIDEVRVLNHVKLMPASSF